MDRTHGLSGRVARSPARRERAGSGRPGSPDGSRDEARAVTARRSVAELYDRACAARLLGHADATLLEFARTFSEPRTAASTPADPGGERVNEFTLWLAVRGIEEGEAIARRPGQPLTFSEALEVYARLSREFGTISTEESLLALDSLRDFFALVLRYPMIPRLVADTKECPECYFETDITLDTWEETRRMFSCCHFTLRHEGAEPPVDPDSAASAALDLGNSEGFGEVAGARPSGGAFPGTERPAEGTGGGPRSVRFLEQLESIKRRDEMDKQIALGKEVVHQLRSYVRTLEELEAPRYLSTHPVRWLHRFYGSLNRSRERARLLATRCPDPAREDYRTRAGLEVEQLKLSLASVASTGTNDKLLSYVCMASLDPVRRYTDRYNGTAERIVLFKHLVASGLSVETSWSLVRSVSRVAKVPLIGATLSEGVDRQLKHTTRPTPYNRKIASLVWLFAHITSYCTLRKLPHGYVLMGDSPEELSRDGIYVFDDDHVGFRLSARGQRGSDSAQPVASAHVPFERIAELLAMRDRVCEIFRR
uniref:Uncharacterized protein n=1 Tax=Oryzias latipes TaxID=8090 RepID=A0A286P9X6_ORYLA|nr:hypothetical protein ORF64-like [Oryzias latipes]